MKELLNNPIGCDHDKSDISSLIEGSKLPIDVKKQMYERINSCVNCCDYFIELDYKTGRNRSIELTLSKSARRKLAAERDKRSQKK